VSIRWSEIGGNPDCIELATERREIEIAGEPAVPAVRAS
jgi:hypothetical protein